MTYHSQIRSRYRQVEPPPSKPPATYEGNVCSNNAQIVHIVEKEKILDICEKEIFVIFW